MLQDKLSISALIYLFIKVIKILGIFIIALFIKCSEKKLISLI